MIAEATQMIHALIISRLELTHSARGSYKRKDSFKSNDSLCLPSEEQEQIIVTHSSFMNQVMKVH